jgi:hypothetical protein
VSELRSFSSLSRARQASLIRRRSIVAAHGRRADTSVNSLDKQHQYDPASLSPAGSVHGFAPAAGGHVPVSVQTTPISHWSADVEHGLITNQDEDDPQSTLPYPAFGKTAFVYLHQTNPIRRFCIEMVNQPYPACWNGFLIFGLHMAPGQPTFLGRWVVCVCVNMLFTSVSAFSIASQHLHYGYMRNNCCFRAINLVFVRWLNDRRAFVERYSTGV